MRLKLFLESNKDRITGIEAEIGKLVADLKDAKKLKDTAKSLKTRGEQNIYDQKIKWIQFSLAKAKDALHYEKHAPPDKSDVHIYTSVYSTL